MRRIYDHTKYDFLAPLTPMNSFITISAFCLGASQVFFLGNFVWSLCFGKKAEQNPWQANTLEWTVPSPAPEHNYTPVPTVHHGPYEYGVSADKEWVSQVEPEGAAPKSAH